AGREDPATSTRRAGPAGAAAPRCPAETGRGRAQTDGQGPRSAIPDARRGRRRPDAILGVLGGGGVRTGGSSPGGKVYRARDGHLRDRPGPARGLASPPPAPPAPGDFLVLAGPAGRRRGAGGGGPAAVAERVVGFPASPEARSTRLRACNHFLN